MGKKTPLYDKHLASHGKMVDFAGWELPIHYGSQLAEHQCVRESAGVFDVSHMTVIDLEGPGVAAYLRYLLANNIDRLTLGQALYSCMLNEAGGVLDDLIVYKIHENFYRLVVNAATCEKDLAWFKQHLNDTVKLTKRNDVVMLATQGPQTLEKICSIFEKEAEALSQLKNFHTLRLHHQFVARTGYTGEDGYEWILPASEAPAFWTTLLEHHFLPCGLGARDTLRLEAGLNLYGTDMDERVTPLESNLAWTVAFEPQERNFIGRQALEEQRQAGVKRQLVGLILEEGIPRSHQKVIIEGIGEGEITSGSFSPTLKKGIALARVPAGAFDHCLVEIRGKRQVAKRVKPPFVKRGKGI
ncbi:MAG TPA: glycine cleavage system aminomethyltransferase GcvT, partial [Gammaproteobacteria bacterium]|nr:glycine cleavage system aminomethyltransferase GcvT [Gammaproteobacteria bacterium]